MSFIKHKCNRYIYPSRLWNQVLWHWKTVSNPELLAFGQTEVEKADRGWLLTDKRQKTATNHRCTRNWRNFAQNFCFDRKMDTRALEWKRKYKETKAIMFCLTISNWCDLWGLWAEKPNLWLGSDHHFKHKNTRVRSNNGCWFLRDVTLHVMTEDFRLSKTGLFSSSLGYFNSKEIAAKIKNA